MTIPIFDKVDALPKPTPTIIDIEDKGCQTDIPDKLTQAKIRQYQIENHQLRQENFDLRKELDEFNEKFERRRADYRRKNRTIADLQDQLNQIRIESNNKDWELTNLQAQIDQGIEKLKNSERLASTLSQILDFSSENATNTSLKYFCVNALENEEQRTSGIITFYQEYTGIDAPGQMFANGPENHQFRKLAYQVDGLDFNFIFSHIVENEIDFNRFVIVGTFDKGLEANFFRFAQIFVKKVAAFKANRSTRKIFDLAISAFRAKGIKLPKDVKISDSKHHLLGKWVQEHSQFMKNKN